MSDRGNKTLQRFDLPTPVRLSLLWASVMFLYIYNDYFSMYQPGMIDMMSEGSFGPLGEATDLMMVAVALILTIPALMIFLSSALAAPVSRVSNIVLGVIYTLIEAATLIGSAPFYRMVVGFEILITVLIVWTALRWPKAANAS